MNNRRITPDELYAAASALPEGERNRFLFENCNHDWGLFQRLRGHIEKTVEPPASPEAAESVFPGAEAEAQFPTLLTSAGRYLIRSTLDEGGAGVVYLADQEWPVKRRVALKILRDTENTEQARVRFAAERQALALMDHPHIARVYEAGATSDGRLFLVMEYVDGLPITEHCRQHEVAIAGRIELLIQVCRALAHAHQKGIIHRDLKPSNILITRLEGKPAVKIIDFGLAKTVSGLDPGAAVFPSPGDLLGTLNYMSPEQANPRVMGVDTRSDIYSLGAVAYETLAGAVPTDLAATARTHRETVTALYDSVPVLPSVKALESGDRAVAKSLRQDLDWVVMKALEKDPAKRYQTAGDLAADLRRYLARSPVLAAPPRLRGYRMKLFLRRHRSMMATFYCVVVAAVLGILAATHLSRSLAASATLASERRSEILRLSDSELLREYEKEVDGLVPPRPQLIGAMESWMAKAERLASRLPLHRRTLAALETAGSGTPGDGREATNPDGVEEAFHHDLLASLVSDLETFVDPDPYVGAIAAVRKRLSFARTVYEKSIEEHAREWDAAIHSIANPAECPAYRGLVISPQVGLVPIGRNPRTGLWEFADLATGLPPERDGHGKLVVTDRTGVVLVLIPEGRFWMGAPRTRPPDPFLGSPTTDYFFWARPGHTVELGAYFLSKYEMTQGQWLRLAGSNPSGFAPEESERDARTALTRPVEMIPWNETVKVLSRAGLTLPTEAQWEYAARAGTVTPWWTGPVYTSLEGAENLADLSAAKERKTRLVEWNDGFPGTAPVGSFRPNPFGLYDVIGNIREWCMDLFADSYRFPHRKGDGLQLVRNGEKRTCRGGSFAHHPISSFAAKRWPFVATDRDLVGVRPARPLEREGAPAPSSPLVESQ